MSRGNGPIWRPLAVWLLATAAAASASTWLPASWALARATNPAPIEATSNVLVAVCATGLAIALAWLWLITTSTVIGVMRGAVPTNAGTTRRLVLLACGVAVAAGATVPAQASDGDTAQLLSGLPLPDRAVSQTHDPGHTDAGPHEDEQHEKARGSAAASGAAETEHGAEPASPEVSGREATAYVVRPGDSLWAIAQRHPAAGTDVNERWQEIWAANREVVGEDPDLIRPGQQLRLTQSEDEGEGGTDAGNTPQTDQGTHTHQDGE